MSSRHRYDPATVMTWDRSGCRQGDDFYHIKDCSSHIAIALGDSKARPLPCCRFGLSKQAAHCPAVFGLSASVTEAREQSHWLSSCMFSIQPCSLDTSSRDPLHCYHAPNSHSTPTAVCARYSTTLPFRLPLQLKALQNSAATSRLPRQPACCAAGSAHQTP